MSNPQGEPQDLQASISDQARDWVLRLSSGEMDEEEIDRLKKWIAADDTHARAFEHRRLLWLQLGEHPELFGQPKLAPARPRRLAWMRLPTRSRRAATAATAMAASILALLVAPEAILRMEADHRTAASVAEYTLPDGSTAWLDAGSALRVDFGMQDRNVTLLRGNAFFTVRHGDTRPFRVAARHGIVEDIGTSFEVRRGPAIVDVAVTEGLVRVIPERGRGHSAILREGQSVTFDKFGTLSETITSYPHSIAAWRREEMMIDRQALGDVIEEIGRYRSGPTWIWGDLNARPPVSGALRIDDADAALRDLAAEQKLKIAWLPGGIAIVRNGNATTR